MKRALALLILVGILAGAIAYNVRARNAPAQVSGVENTPLNIDTAVPVTVASVQRRTAQETITLTGVLKPDQQAAVSAKVPARITSVVVTEGARVRQGQTVVRLDVSDSAAQIRGAQAAVTAAQAQYRKAVDGKRARGVELDASVAQAVGGLRTAQAKLRQAELGVPLTASASKADRDRAEAAVKQAKSGLEQADINLKQAEDSLKRAEFLYSHGGVPRAEVEGARSQAAAARSQRDSAKAALEQAEAALTPAVETAPLRTRVSEADVEAARAGVRQAQEGVVHAKRARAEALRLADRDIETAQADVRRAEAGVEQARSQVGSGVLTSPLDGTVTDVMGHPGEVAQPGMPILTVVSPGSIYLEALAPARYALSLRVGQPARVTLDTMPNRPLGGEITEVLPIAGQDQRSLRVKIRLPRGGRLTPGVGAQAVVTVAHSANAISAPVDALRSEGNVSYVYVVESGKAQRRDITLGVVEGAYAQVVAGLAEGDNVIVSGPASLQPGTSVKVVER